MEPIQHIILPLDFSIRDFELLLAQSYAFKGDDVSTERWALYDTFDWRLYNKSLMLQNSGSVSTLLRLTDGVKIASIVIDSLPKFIRDLPVGAFKDALSPVIDIRALLKIAEIETHSKTYHILNQDKKTVARIIYTQVGNSASKPDERLVAYLSLVPIRGYPKYARRLEIELNKLGERSTKWEDIYTLALQAASKKPGSYSSKFYIELDPEMHSVQATKLILLHLLAVIRANEPGIRSDIDIEFLHDFRVAIRRTRSALSQIRSVFPVDITTRFKEDFAYLGKFTNTLRDLDVYLLYEDKYRNMLPDDLRSDISTLFDYLKEQRDEALMDVIHTLDSANYQRTLLEWEAFLSEPETEYREAVNASRPIIDLASERIYKRYQRVLKDGEKILENPQDELMHQLRIDCKKLRYLIEFFASLYPPKKIAVLVNQLKNLQDNLGDFNDFSVQQAYLLNIADTLPSSEAHSRRAFIATGVLIDRLALQQDIVRAAFAETFQDFASPANQELFRRLFSPNKRRKVG